MVQVVHVAMRHIGDLRTIYAFYSRLGSSSLDNIYVLSRLQVCFQGRLLPTFSLLFGLCSSIAHWAILRFRRAFG